MPETLVGPCYGTGSSEPKSVILCASSPEDVPRSFCDAMCDLHQYLVFLLCLAYCLCFNCVFGLTCKVAQRRCTRRFRTSSCFDRCGAVSMHLHCRFELLAPLDNPTGVVCSNGLPGVEANGVCCEAQCGECGGPGCGGRPGGPVRCCICHFRLLPLPFISLAAFNEACSFVYPGP